MIETPGIGPRSTVDAPGADSRVVRPSVPSWQGTGSRTTGAGGGRRGQRMLSPDVNVETLDRSAPRGTYVDLLV